jgi:hypothetical protein
MAAGCFGEMSRRFRGVEYGDMPEVTRSSRQASVAETQAHANCEREPEARMEPAGSRPRSLFYD